jgi:steroid delta-isomerase-like uncharacterized protein
MRTTELVQRAYQAVVQHDMDMLLTIFSADCEFVDITESEAWRGREAFKSYMVATWEAFPDFHPENPTFTAQGNVVAAELELVGTHLGEFLDVAPTGAVVRWRAAAFYTIASDADEITREVYYYDAQSLRAALEFNRRL